MLTSPTVAVVDDDRSVRESLPDLLRELGFEAKAFASAAEFLESNSPQKFRCLILDVVMPGIDGFDLQQEIQRRPGTPSIIFITANRDESIRRRAIELGAVECLFKPFSDTALQQALSLALKTD